MITFLPVAISYIIASFIAAPRGIRIIIANPTVPSIMYAEQNDSFFDNFYSADYY